MSPEGLHFLAEEEGCVLHPYKDSRGVWTIGIGNTYYPDGTRVKPTDPPLKNRDQAIFLFKGILSSFEKFVWSVTRDDINQHNFDAITSLSYNIGTTNFKTSTLLRKLNADPKDPSIAKEFLRWRYSEGAPILLGRRKREAKLYFS